MIEGVVNNKYHHHDKKGISPTRRIALSFLGVIFIGSLLLCLPIANNQSVAHYIDNLFISVSATCVTGLVPVVTKDQYSFFGQLVILLMIQIGGLGFLTFLNLLIIKIRRKLTLDQKLTLQEAMNQNTLKSLPNFVRNVMKFTFLVEGIGALILATQFIPKFGLVDGLWYSIFHSVSAFCNAGFDVLGSNSLINYQTNPIVSLTIAGLIISGGLGFIVWFDIYRKFRGEAKKPCRFNKHRFFSKLTNHSKIVIITTFVLLVVGTILFLICESENVLKGFNIFDMIQISFFQSTTLRTAGFATVDVYSLNTITKMFMCLFMFIGGSPAGTAGGIKTTTFAVVVLMIRNIYHGGRELFIFNRRMKKRLIIRATAIVMISFFLVVGGLMILSVVENAPFVDLMFEVFSAFGTVGLSASITPHLSDIGKCVIMLLMFIGRIGPIAMMITFARKSHQTQKGNIQLSYPDEDILIG